jgi:hypothetical protein
MHIYVNGAAIPYGNSNAYNCQAVIDQGIGGLDDYLGYFSGDDGLGNYFCGHNPGCFTPLVSVGIGSTIIVTDANGTPFTYHVTRITTMDDYGYEPNGNFLIEQVRRMGNESVAFQTCLTQTNNLVIIAQM